MSNLETLPDEVVCASGEPTAEPAVQVLEPREVPLGGPRAMDVRRTLPQRGRSLIGAWCFLDHYGPDPVTRPREMDVPPHPHTGLQTVSWLFAGEIEHRDSVGSFALVRPGELHLMTAGRGIQHSEYSAWSADDAATQTLHGAQLWVALPEATRHTAPAFESFVPPPVSVADATLRVFLGELAGVASPVAVHTPLLGAQLDLPTGGRVELDVDPAFEHGLLVDAGAPALQGSRLERGELGYLASGASRIVVEAGEEPVRALLIGGVPLGEEIVMWWNFVGRSHDEVVAFREEWQRSVEGGADAAARFGAIDDPAAPLPAPGLPNLRLRPRA